MGEGGEETTKIETMNKNIYMLTRVNWRRFLVDCFNDVEKLIIFVTLFNLKIRNESLRTDYKR